MARKYSARTQAWNKRASVPFNILWFGFIVYVVTGANEWLSPAWQQNLRALFGVLFLYTIVCVVGFFVSALSDSPDTQDKSSGSNDVCGPADKTIDQ
jgi:hypothetical protein